MEGKTVRFCCRRSFQFPTTKDAPFVDGQSSNILCHPWIPIINHWWFNYWACGDAAGRWILQFSSNDGARASKSVTYSYDRKNSSCVRNDVTKTYHSYHLLLYFKRRKLLRLCNTLMYDYRHAKWWAIRCAPLCAPTSTFWTTLWFCKSSTQNEEYKSYSELKITYIRFWIEPENVTYVRTWMSLSGESKGSSTIKGTAIT